MFTDLILLKKFLIIILFYFNLLLKVLINDYLTILTIFIRTILGKEWLSRKKIKKKDSINWKIQYK